MGNGTFQKTMLRDFNTESNGLRTRPATAKPSKVFSIATSSKPNIPRHRITAGPGPGPAVKYLKGESFMNDKIAFLLNQQINKELYSAYLYLDMSNFYDEMDLDGYANYYMIQAQEERDHALLFMKYMQNNGLKITLEAIDKPDKTFETVLDPLVIAAEHERYVTSLINDIYHEAHQAKDYRTMKFLDWFVDEQGEEEDNADSMVNRYKLFGADPKGLYLLDQEYAGRVYTAPSLVL